MKGIHNIGIGTAVLLMVCSVQAGWTGLTNITGSSGENDLYPEIAVDNIKWNPTDRFGRAHVVWTSYDGDEYRTYYKLKWEIENLGWSEKTVVDTDESLVYASDEPTRPSICTSTNEDRAAIAFVQTRPGWYYSGLMPQGAIFDREILYNWLPEASLSPGDSIDPPDHLHHVSGLQKGIQNCMIAPLNFRPIWGYTNVVFWSQFDADNSPGISDRGIYFNGQRTALVNRLNHIDWVEQRELSIRDNDEVIKLPGDKPYAGSVYNKKEDPSLEDYNMAYYLAVVSESASENRLKLAIVRQSHNNLEYPFEWQIMDIPNTSNCKAQLPSCAFKMHATDPWNNEPELHIVYLTGFPNNSAYYLITAMYNPPQEQWVFSGPVQIAAGSSNYAARPAITFTENGDRWIAFISSDNEVKTKKNDASPVYASLTLDTITHSWVSIAVDSVSLQGGYQPQIACTGKPASQTNWDIFWIKYNN